MDETGKHTKFEVIGFSTFRDDGTKISFPEWNKSSRFDIYPLESSKTREKSLYA